MQRKKKRNEHKQEESLLKDIDALEKHFTKENESDLKTKQMEWQELRKKNGRSAGAFKSEMDREGEQILL